MKLKLFLAALLLGAAVAAQCWLRAHRPVRTPDLEGSALAALGGFRSLAAEVVWFRADRLQEEGRYVELAQLASTLCYLEPHTPEVWSFAAWNLAYNVSIMMPTGEDRWRWVEAALRLLRDDGLRLNPEEGELYRELAWMFQIKFGTDMDSCAAVYRGKWRELVAAARASGDWSPTGLERAKMDEIERIYRETEWENPLLVAVYYAHFGLVHATGNTRAFLNEIRKQSLYALRRGPAK